MKLTPYFKLSLAGLLLSGLITSVTAQTTQDTYLGKIEFQDQTITKASAAKLNRQIWNYSFTSQTVTKKVK